MSELLDALKSLMLFFQDHFPDEANSFLPGLPRNQIVDLFSERSLPCPDEIIDLYSCLNGTSSRFKSFSSIPEFAFMSLEGVVEIYDEYVQTDNLICLNTIDSDYGLENINNALADLNINENYRMIHFVSAPTGEYYSVVLGAESTFVFLYMDEGGQKDLFFQSLTSMFQTISASYQEGAYNIREDKELELESELFKSIWERYNPLLSQGPSSAVIDEYIEAQVEVQNEY